MRAGLVATGDPGWADVLSGVRHDLYHLPGFVEFATRRQAPGIPTAFVATEGDAVLLVPLIIRPIPAAVAGVEGWSDATGPLGYPGPIAGPAGARPDAAFLERAGGAFIETLRERQIVNAFVRCHPLLSPPPDMLGRSGTIVEHGESVSIDLTASPAETWSAIRENHRRGIVRARRDGYVTRVDESWTRLDDFLAIYDAAMDRLGAATRWRMPRDHVLDLRNVPGLQLHLIVVEKDGDLAAAALVSEVDGIVEYHLAGTAADHVAASPTKLLIEETSHWARGRGNRVFHLAGSLRHDDALIRFKRGFSPLRHMVASWRVIADPAAHQRLVDRWAWRGGALASPADADFFPVYRLQTPPVQPDSAPADL